VPAGRLADAHGRRRGVTAAVADGTEEAMSEANISTERAAASQETRLSPSHAHPGRPGDHQGSPLEGPYPAVGLIWPIRSRKTFAVLSSSRGATGSQATGSQTTRARIGPLTVSFLDGSPAEPPRVAYAIGRKVGSAVKRNRIRRRLRSIFRELAPHLRPGSYLIGVAPQATELRYGELRTTVIQALQAVTDRQARRPSSASTRP
jgi:ribonuclease P protein component